MTASKYPDEFYKLIIKILVLTLGLIFIPNLTMSRVWDDLRDGDQFMLGPRIINVYYLEASKTFVSFGQSAVEGSVSLKHLDTGSISNLSFLLEPSSIYIETRRDVECFVLPPGLYNVSINIIYGGGLDISLTTFGIIPEDYLLFVYLLFFGVLFFLFYNAYKEDPEYYKNLKYILKKDSPRKEVPHELKDEQRAYLEQFIVYFLTKNRGRAFSLKRLQDRLAEEFLTEEINDAEIFWHINNNLEEILKQLVANNSISTNTHEGIKFYLIPP